MPIILILFTLFAEHMNVILDSVSKEVWTEKWERVDFQLRLQDSLGICLIDV